MKELFLLDIKKIDENLVQSENTIYKTLQRYSCNIGDYENSVLAEAIFIRLGWSNKYKDTIFSFRPFFCKIVEIYSNENPPKLKDGSITKLKSDSITSQDEFDAWHHSVSDKIKKLYLDEGVKLTYGQAQKWINMTIKYLYMLEANSFDGVFEFLHIPLDNYVFDIARDLLGIARPKVAWSSWDNYDEQYLCYQNLIREKITTGTPLRWEFRYWLKVARNIEE